MSEDLLPAERKVLEPVPQRRRRPEAHGAKVLAIEPVSWTSFVGLWVLWVWGKLGTVSDTGRCGHRSGRAGG